MKDFPTLRKIIEALPENEIHIRNDAGDWGGKGTPTHAFVSEYLRSLEQQREEELGAKSLSISLEANSIARNALKIAIAAMILSIIMAIKEIIPWPVIREWFQSAPISGKSATVPPQQSQSAEPLPTKAKTPVSSNRPSEPSKPNHPTGADAKSAAHQEH